MADDDTDHSHSLSRVGLGTGLFATAIVLMTTLVVVVGALHLLGLEIGFAQYVLSGTPVPSMYWVPSPFMSAIGGAGLDGTAMAVIVAVLNAALLTLVCGMLAYGITRAMNRRRTQQTFAEQPENQPTTKYSPRLVAPSQGCHLSILDYSGTIIANPAPEAHLWLRRTPMRVTDREAIDSPLDEMQLALLEVLEAHADWSSDPAGHHADVGLKAHSIAVAEQIADALPEEPLAVIAGLAHDIGKILAYRRGKRADGEEIWERGVRNHSHLSVHIVRCLPEFHRLERTDQQVLIAVLAHAHAPHLIAGPKNPSKQVEERIRRITDTVRAADGLTTRRDLQSAAAKAEDAAVVTEIADHIAEAIFQLNVNRALAEDANSEGCALAIHPYVAVLLAPLRERLAPLLRESTQVSLGIRTNAIPGQLHPSAPAILEALEQKGWLMRDYGALSSDPPVYAVISGAVELRPVVLLRRDALTKESRDLVARWGESKYPLRVVKTRAAGG